MPITNRTYHKVEGADERRSLKERPTPIAGLIPAWRPEILTDRLNASTSSSSVCIAMKTFLSPKCPRRLNIAHQIDWIRGVPGFPLHASRSDIPPIAKFMGIGALASLVDRDVRGAGGLPQQDLEVCGRAITGTRYSQEAWHGAILGLR